MAPNVTERRERGPEGFAGWEPALRRMTDEDLEVAANAAGDLEASPAWRALVAVVEGTVSTRERALRKAGVRSKAEYAAHIAKTAGIESVLSVPDAVRWEARRRATAAREALAKIEGTVHA